MKVDKLHLIKMKNLCASKTLWRKWKDNIQHGRKFASHLDNEGLVFRIYKEEKEKQLNLKNRQRRRRGIEIGKEEVNLIVRRWHNTVYIEP